CFTNFAVLRGVYILPDQRNLASSLVQHIYTPFSSTSFRVVLTAFNRKKFFDASVLDLRIRDSSKSSLSPCLKLIKLLMPSTKRSDGILSRRLMWIGRCHGKVHVALIYLVLVVSLLERTE
ncbi:hypothetical protein OCU04_008288, partial [Sclerotinia nivalis]